MDNTYDPIFYKCNVENCNLKTFNNQDRCVLHCNKDTWSEANNDFFWKEISLLPQEKDDFFMFSDIVFPLFPIKYHFYKIGFEDKNYVLTEDYLFWERGQSKSFKNLAQFTNCTFYDFKFFYTEAQTINLRNCIVKNDLTFVGTYIKNIIIRSTEMNYLCISSSSINMLDLSNFFADNIEMKNIKIESITLSNLKINTVDFNNISIKKGKFEDLYINTVKSNATLFLDDIKKFFYKNVIVKNADREYFRFFKKIFNEKDDFINANEMYRCEMESYYKEI